MHTKYTTPIFHGTSIDPNPPMTAPSAASSAATSAATSPSLAGVRPPVLNSFSLGTIPFRSLVEEVLDLQHGSYGSWRERVELQLAIFHMLDHVANNVVSRPEDPEWYQADLTVKSWLYAVISPELRAMVSSPTASSRAIWVAIESVFRSNGMARAMNLTEEFQRQKQGDLPVSTYCARLKAISDALRDLGYPLSNHALLLQLVRGLHDRHKMTAKMIQKEAATLNFPAAVDMLSMDEMQEHSAGHSLSNTALFVNRPPAPSGSHGGQGSYGAPGTPSPNQGKTKLKHTSNHGGYSTAPSLTSPWTGMVQA